MTASLETLVIAAYVFADALPDPSLRTAGKATDAELIALSVAQAVLGVPSDRQFLGMVRRLLPGWSRAVRPIAVRPAPAAVNTPDPHRADDAGRRA